MRRGNTSWINETRKEAKRNDKCQFWMTFGVYSGFKDITFNVHLYDNSSFDFGLETELDLISSVAKLRNFEIFYMRLAKTQFGQSICTF